jgi:hypothetical protein
VQYLGNIKSKDVGKGHFMFLEYCEMGSISDISHRLKDSSVEYGCFDEKEIAYILSRVILAIEELGSVNLNHQDIKVSIFPFLFYSILTIYRDRIFFLLKMV